MLKEKKAAILTRTREGGTKGQGVSDLEEDDLEETTLGAVFVRCSITWLPRYSVLHIWIVRVKRRRMYKFCWALR